LDSSSEKGRKIALKNKKCKVTFSCEISIYFMLCAPHIQSNCDCKVALLPQWLKSYFTVTMVEKLLYSHCGEVFQKQQKH
jgi:hypothetical protein